MNDKAVDFGGSPRRRVTEIDYTIYGIHRFTCSVGSSLELPWSTTIIPLHPSLPLSDPPLVAVSVPLGQQLGGHCAPQLLRHVPRKLHGADLGGGSEWKDRGQGEELAAEGYRTHITCMQGHAWHAPRSRRARGGSREWLESAGDAAVKILQSANGAITESARTTGRGTQE